MQTNDPEFDQYGCDYQSLVEESIRLFGMSHDYVTRVKAELIVSVARQEFGGLESRRALDVGCGIGLTDTYLVDEPWHVSGIDVSPRSVEQARQRNPTVNYVVGDGHRLPFDDESFDVCFAVCVMHHVLPHQWTAFLAELRRVLKPGGIVLILEHNPFNPLTRLVVNRCPFDAGAVLLSRGRLCQQLESAQLEPRATRYFLFTPWERLRFLDRLLGWLPFGAQYCTIADRSR